MAKSIDNISAFSEQEKREIKDIKEELNALSENEVERLYTQCVSKYPRMRRWKFPTTTLRGSREQWCAVCGRKTRQVVLVNSNLPKLQVGLFCPKCDKPMIETLMKRGGQVVPNLGLGRNVPLDSKGFDEGSYGPWRSEGGDRDIGSRSGTYPSGFLAEKMMKTQGQRQIPLRRKKEPTIWTYANKNEKMKLPPVRRGGRFTGHRKKRKPRKRVKK